MALAAVCELATRLLALRVGEARVLPIELKVYATELRWEPPAAAKEAPELFLISNRFFLPRGKEAQHRWTTFGKQPGAAVCSLRVLEGIASQAAHDPTMDPT